MKDSIKTTSSSLLESLRTTTNKVNYLDCLQRRQLGLAPTKVSLRRYCKQFQSHAYNIFHTEEEVGIIPPFSVRFNNVKKNAKLLAMVDEEGALDIVNTHYDAKHESNLVNKRDAWQAHEDAILDVCWSLDDTCIATAGGDRLGKVWDTSTRKLRNVFISHTGSVKTISAHPFDPHIYVTAGRDGNIMIWDTRCTSGMTGGQRKPADCIMSAHGVKPNKKRRRESSGNSQVVHVHSVSSAKYLVSNPHVLVSAGVGDGSIKLWDARYHGYNSSKSFPVALETSYWMDHWKRAHGYSSIALDPNGSWIYVICTDNHVYQYSALDITIPRNVYSAKDYQCSSFYVQVTVSPDGEFIASGSSSSKIHIWETDSRRAVDPVGTSQKPSFSLAAHGKEVMGVDWNRVDFSQLASSSDDGTVRVWNIERSPDYKAPLELQSQSSAIEENEPTLDVCLDDKRPVGRIFYSSRPTIKRIIDVCNKENVMKKASMATKHMLSSQGIKRTNESGVKFLLKPLAPKKTLLDYFSKK